MKQLVVLGLLGLLGISSAMAVNCGPVQDPCSSNPTQTFSWTCSDGQTCGTAYCVHICSAATSGSCMAGNYPSMDVTFPWGSCNPQG